jgi:hypothetical protein
MESIYLKIITVKRFGIGTKCRFKVAYNDRVLLSGREFGKLLLSNAGQALLAAILLLAAVR